VASFVPVDKNLIQIGDVASNQMRDISEAITSFDVSLTMDGASELTLEVLDINFAFAKANYFQVRRDVFYQNLIFEIVVVEVQGSDSVHPIYRLSCRNKNVQMMKRDKSPEAYKGVSASEYAKTVARRFNMNYVVEDTTKKQSIVKGRNAQSDESVWTVLQRSASDAQFVCFETDNILFFCSQQFLLGKWGDPRYKFGAATFVPFGWPEPNETFYPGAGKRYMLLDVPNVRRSDDDPMDADGNLLVDRANGRLLRPGMTIWLGGVPDFESTYLITGVEFNEGVPDPVTVSFRTPLKPDPQAVKAVGSAGGGGGGGSRDAALPVNIFNAISDYIKRNYRVTSTSTPESLSRGIQITTNSALELARRIFNAKELSQKQALYDQFRNSLGFNNIVFKALTSVSNLLLGSYSISPSATGLNNLTLNRIDSFVNERVQNSTERAKLRSDIVSQASKIYKATTTTQQNILFNQSRTRFGESSIQYQCLEAIRFLIARPAFAELDSAFPFIM
jgi:hypothetical protein